MSNPIYKNKRYTHLPKQDHPVWERFLNSPANIYTHFEYDVHVGDGRDPGQIHTDDIRKLAVMLSQRRIDAIGYHKDHLGLFEVTRTAGLKALGQLIAYPVLYQLKYNPELAIKPILIAEDMQTDKLDSFNQNRITVMLYGTP